MKKRLIRKQLIAGMLCALVFVCGTQPVGAAQPEAAVSPALFQCMMRFVGLKATLQPGPNDDFPVQVTVQGIGNGSFTLGFPSGGLKRNAPFYLANDDAAALVQLSNEGTLTVIDGDEHIIASGIFSMIACILIGVFTMVAEILYSALTLNIGGILAAVFSGVANILYCVGKIVA